MMAKEQSAKQTGLLQGTPLGKGYKKIPLRKVSKSTASIILKWKWSGTTRHNHIDQLGIRNLCSKTGDKKLMVTLTEIYRSCVEMGLNSKRTTIIAAFTDHNS